MTEVLRGKVCLVTGASGGIGSALVRSLAAAGAEVCAATRSILSHGVLYDLAEEFSGRVWVYAVDPGDPSDVHDTFDRILETHGRVDVLANCAGIAGPNAPLIDTNGPDWWEVFEINVRATTRMIRTVVPAMQQRRSGKIINLAGAGVGGKPPSNFSAYYASKAALVALTEALSLELAPVIQVNAVAPGFVRTKLTEAMFGEVEARDRDEGPEAICDLVKFLASDASGTLTGKLISAKRDDWRSPVFATEAGWGHRESLFKLRRIDGVNYAEVTK